MEGDRVFYFVHRAARIAAPKICVEVEKKFFEIPYLTMQEVIKR
jgi:hypothetical protein